MRRVADAVGGVARPRCFALRWMLLCGRFISHGLSTLHAVGRGMLHSFVMRWTEREKGM